MTTLEFTLDELLALYSTIQSELFELNCSDFDGCEQAMIKDHTIAAKLLDSILTARRLNANTSN